jgi:hypothetical protein
LAPLPPGSCLASDVLRSLGAHTLYAFKNKPSLEGINDPLE